MRVDIDAGGYEARQQAPQAGRCNPADSTWSTDVALADGQLLSGSEPDGRLGVAGRHDGRSTRSAAPTSRADQNITVGPFALTVSADSGFVQAP